MTTTVRREPNSKSLSALKSSSYIIGAFCLVGVIYWVLASLGLFGSNVKGKQSKQGEKSQGKKNASKTPVTKKAQASPGLKESTEILPNSAKDDKTLRERLSPDDKASKPIASQKEKPKEGERERPPVRNPIDTITSKAPSSSPSPSSSSLLSSSPSPPPSSSPSPPPSSLPSSSPSSLPSSSPSSLPSSSPSPSPSSLPSPPPSPPPSSLPSSSPSSLPSSPPLSSLKTTENSNIINKAEIDNKKADDASPEKRSSSDERSPPSAINQKEKPKEREDPTDSSPSKAPSSSLPSSKATKDPNTTEKTESENENTEDASSEEEPSPTEALDLPMSQQKSSEKLSLDKPLKSAVSEKEIEESSTQETAETLPSQTPSPPLFPSLSLSKEVETESESSKTQINKGEKEPEHKKEYGKIEDVQEIERKRRRNERIRKEGERTLINKRLYIVLIRLKQTMLMKPIAIEMQGSKFQILEESAKTICTQERKHLKEINRLMGEKQDSSNKGNLFSVDKTVTQSAQCISANEYFQPQDFEINFFSGLNLKTQQFMCNFLSLISIKIDDFFDDENLRSSEYITDDMVVQIRRRFIPLLSEKIYEMKEWDKVSNRWVVVPGSKRTTDQALWVPIVERVLIFPSHIKFFEPKMPFQLYKSLVMTHAWYLRSTLIIKKGLNMVL